MSNGVKKIYDNFVSNNFISFDKKQIQILEDIESTWEESKKIRFFSKSIKYNGVYVNGSVGIGKTFILNLFIQSIKKSKKIHFNHFMIDLHAFINNTKEDFALEIYINKFSKKYNIIFIDELHIFNIVDALLIKKIFNLFKKNKIFILISSNFKPNELYKDGLQRNDFIPFISFIEKNFKIINMLNIKDYRRQTLNQSKTYFTPVNPKTSDEFIKLFDRFVDQGEIHVRKIKIKSRIIRFEKCTSNIVFCLFADLCEVNFAHEDYLNIAKTFKLLFIKNVPCFTSSESDQCRRFISLIDMLYDQECSVVILAEKPINKLCKIKSLEKEFERTSSRLYEMTIVSPDIK
jgi:cell division protein ZapE